ncbi:allophanate hydrolase [Brucella pituitosa]|uniref:Allophanate hydrolase n=1 Tax=Brucella pituitosa TaxID=571256 RepID=A0ABS3K2M4_9HYPH|nr:allophanate hydrolase [Brucella pituitosa]MBO1041171.1 allophanate hydrolase [Brucella pituitosa]
MTAANHSKDFTIAIDELGDIGSYRSLYASGVDPIEVILTVYDRVASSELQSIWINLVPRENVLALATDLLQRKLDGCDLPLFGIPFAVKDNIDVLGVPTTAGCPDFEYLPSQHAFVVEKLISAGAIPLGKTNLDQFATGLNGTRSPYGIPSCVFDKRYISGGSSSGSAVAVAQKLVAFSLGTDTAGSGRVPAALNNLVGIKPTRGLLSNSGLVRAARSLDCISIFAHSVDDALLVLDVASHFDPSDAFSRVAPSQSSQRNRWPAEFTFGLPDEDQLEFFGDADAQRLFRKAIRTLEELGGTAVRFDYTPFKLAAEMLYAGPWVAERFASIKDFALNRPNSIHPVVREIILSASTMSAADAFEGAYRLADLIRQTEAVWTDIDVMVLPTAPTTYTIEEMIAEPVKLNSNLGLYTNFVNLMDLSAIAVPAGFGNSGLPFGVSLIGPAFEDKAIARLGKAFISRNPASAAREQETISIAVVGAHLSGQPLNHQLTDRGGVLRQTSRTASGYAFYALEGTVPAKPGLIRDETAAGGIELELWDLPASGFGTFVNAIPAPLGIGTIKLEDGSEVKGFLCEPFALRDAKEITHFGGWRFYQASLQQPLPSH